MATTATAEPLELIWEVSEIARFIGRTERQTFHMLATGQIPAKKIGARWVADRKSLERFFNMGTAH
jgi:hypothetical protein